MFELLGTIFIAVAGITGVAATIAAVFIAASKHEKERRGEWDVAAERLGIRKSKRGWSSYHLEGTIIGLPVEVRAWGGKNAHTALEVKIPFSRLRLTAEGFGSAIGKLVSGEDIRTGDLLFDEKAVLRGDAAEHRALFDAPTRDAAKALLALGGWVADGSVQMRVSGVVGKAGEIEDRMRTMTALAAHLQRLAAVPVPERLVALAIGDPSPGVRRNALVSLLDEREGKRYMIGPALTGRAITAMLGDVDPANRYFAATRDLAVAADARATLLALARDGATPDTVRARSIAALGKLEGVPDADALLDEIVAHGQPESRVCAIEVVGLRDASPARVIEHAKAMDAATRATVARALGRIADPATQPVLVEMLRDPDEAVRLSAIRALEAFADVRAVEALLPLTEGMFAGDQKRAAQSAISAIQSRVAGAGAGQLTVTDDGPTAGALSESTATDGALSETDPRPQPRKQST